MIVWDINPQALDELAREVILISSKLTEQIEQGGGKVHTFRVDITNKEEVRRTAERILAEIGVVDVLINNAGVVAGNLVWELR